MVWRTRRILVVGGSLRVEKTWLCDVERPNEEDSAMLHSRGCVCALRRSCLSDEACQLCMHSHTCNSERPRSAALSNRTLAAISFSPIAQVVTSTVPLPPASRRCAHIKIHKRLWRCGRTSIPLSNMSHSTTTNPPFDSSVSIASERRTMLSSATFLLAPSATLTPVSLTDGAIINHQARQSN